MCYESRTSSRAIDRSPRRRRGCIVRVLARPETLAGGPGGLVDGAKEGAFQRVKCTFRGEEGSRERSGDQGSLHRPLLGDGLAPPRGKRRPRLALFMAAGGSLR